MGYPQTPASLATAINHLNPNAECTIDGDKITWGTGTPNSDGEMVATTTVPSGCSNSEIIAKKDQLNADRAKALLRLERDKRLAETDWWDLSDTTAMTDDQKKYRQDLRDLPATQNPIVSGSQLSNVTWPVKP
tara:strand:+ start:511 stop:909 length:399 start_codon:yes stop_codon:yes gene_type:complete